MKKLKEKKESCNTHYEIGKEVRNIIEKLNGTLPENLPTPKRSLKNWINIIIVN